MKLAIPSLAILGIIVSSCATTDSFVTDDVYSVRPSELPVGESLTDETSYASFKTRKLGNTDDRLTYADEMAMNQRQNCLNQWRWTANCGCSYNDWYNSSPNSPRNNMFRNPARMHMYIGYGSMYNPYNSYYGMYPSYGFGSYYGYPYYANNMGYGMAHYSGFSMGYGYSYGYNYNPYYGYYGNPYGGYGYGYGYPYGNYGYGYGGYGYGGNSNGWSNNGGSVGTSNTIRKARGTVSGYSNPNGRTQSPYKAGITTVNNPSSGVKTGAASNSSRIEAKPVEKGSVISRETAYTRQNTGRIDSGVIKDRNSSISVETIENNRQPSRTSEIRNSIENRQGTIPNRTNSPVPSNNGRVDYNNSRSTPTLSTPQRTMESPSQRISTPSSSPSRSTSTPSNSGSGSGSSSGRSGSGSSMNSGRR